MSLNYPIRNITLAINTRRLHNQEKRNILHALQDVRIGWPGILIQIVGGFLVIKALEKC